MIEARTANDRSGPSVTTGHSPRLTGTCLWASRFLSREERRILGDSVLSTRSVGPNTDLVREGARADMLLIAVDGWACRYTQTAEGDRQITALLVPGDVSNLNAFIFNQPDHSVRTLTRATILALPYDRLLALAEQHPGIARTVTWLALLENAILSRWILGLGRRSVRERLAHLLCELNARLGGADEGESRFAFPLTQMQLGDALGLTSVHISRTVQQLRSEGMIAIHKRTVTLPDVAGLCEIGGFDRSYLDARPLTKADLT